MYLYNNLTNLLAKMRSLYLTIILLALTMISCNTISTKSEFSIEEATISSIRTALEEGTITCEELVGLYLKRIEKYDQPGGLNSIVLINPDALETAREKDQLIKKGQALPPMHGIPVIVKDNYNTIGLQTAAGSMAMKGFEPEYDSWIVKKLKDAGAIVLAKSNMAEWAFSPMVTISSIAGETRNPYNLDHVPAGSSGGTAAAVAANLGAVGLGTDTGNSIRGPSSHNALVGFRTTLGLVSRAGIVPLYLRNDVGGPITRTVEDATIMLDIIAGYDPDDPLTEHSKGNIPGSYMDFLIEDGLMGLRIGVFQDILDRGIDPQVQDLFSKAIIDLQAYGAIIIENIKVENFEELSQGHWAPAFHFDLNNYLEAQGPSVPVKSLDEVIAANNYSDYIKDNLIYHQQHPENPAKQDPPALDVYSDPGRSAYRLAIESLMEELELDALIYPTWSYPPAKIGKFDEYLGDNSQIVSPHTGQPAFTIPMGFTQNNLPAGIQFLGKMFDEPTLIKIAYSYEQATNHRKPPANFSE
jgi:amidase